MELIANEGLERATVSLSSVLPGFAVLSTMLILSTKIDVALLTFTPIDLRWYRSDTASSTAIFSAVNLTPNVNLWTEFCLFDNQVTGVDPITENIPVIDLP
eukprot:15365713-Ditylum_brightwellii.AAC.3